MEEYDLNDFSECLKHISNKHLILCRGDITKFPGDAIVNAANSSLLGGGGVDGAIHRAAGYELYQECKTLGGCNTGEAKITKGYNLKARNVIHTVGPIYDPEKDTKHANLLKNCYWNSLELAKQNNIHSIAFPCIATGVYGYPHDKAADIAVNITLKWLIENDDYAMDVVLVCYQEMDYDYYKKLFLQ